MLDPTLRPILAETVAFDAAQTALVEAGLDDGLPLVPPTARRLAAMLQGIAQPEAWRGAMPPLLGDVTAEDVAYQCVIAGCRPGVVPIVLAAAEACLEPDFNLLGLMTTTGSAAVATIVHGPIASRLGVNGSSNCLGPGSHANATIGRAVSLVLRNIGGARPGTGDMATIGQPVKYTFCLAEAQSGALPSLSERRGLGADVSAVTVLGVSGTAEVLPDEERATPEQILDPLIRIMQASHATTGAGRRPKLPEQVFLLPPEMAGQLADAGWGLARIQAHVAAGGVAASPSAVHPILAGGPGVKMCYLPLWGGGSRTVTRVVDARVS